MLIREILYETTSDDVDLQNIARYIFSYIKYQQLQGKYNFRFRLSAAFNRTNKIPNIRNQQLKEKLSKLRIIVKVTDEDTNSAEFIPDDNAIILYPNQISTDYGILTYTIHELQHAWDYEKSKGLGFKFIDPNTSYYEYTKSNEEINARFSQVLLNLADINITNKNIIEYIKKCFKNYSIFRELYDEGPKGQQKYNQLLKRAYKFCIDMKKYEKFNHQELPRKTLQKMIKKTLKDLNL